MCPSASALKEPLFAEDDLFCMGEQLSLLSLGVNQNSYQKRHSVQSEPWVFRKLVPSIPRQRPAFHGSVETLSLYQHPLCQPVFINRLDFEQGGHSGQHIETVLGSIHSRLQLAGLSWTCSEATWSLRPFSHKLQHRLHPILQPLCRAQILKGAKPNVKKGFKDPFKKDRLSRPCQIFSRTF